MSLFFPSLFLSSFFSWPSSYGNESCATYMRVKISFCSKFPVVLARQSFGSLPTFCKSSLANQNSCWKSPDPEFPDKEIFMLSFFKANCSRLRVGVKKNLSPTLDYEGCRWCIWVCTLHCLFDNMEGGSVHVWLACLQQGEICWLQVFPWESLLTICFAWLKGNPSL